MPSNVLEIKLELVDDEALHLIGAHANVIQEDVDLRNIERGKDVHPHPCVGQGAAADQGHDQHQRRDGSAHGEDGRVHNAYSGADRAWIDLGVDKS